MNTIAKMFQQAIKFTKFAFENRNRPIEKMLFIIIFLHKIFMKKPYIIFKFLDGTTFLLFNVGDFISVSLSNEPETFKFIMKQIKNSKVFVDVGANIVVTLLELLNIVKFMHLNLYQEIIKY